MRCLVVGATKGIGRAIALGLVGRGHEVCGMSRRPPSDARFDWRPLSLDGFDLEIAHQVERALDRLGGIDLLVLSAGMGAMHTPFEETGERARSLMEVNYFGPQTVWRTCLRPLVKSHGTVIVIGSTCADRAAPGLTLYRASKAAMHAFALNQAHVWRDRIRVNVVAPGWVDSDMTAALKPEMKEKITKRIPAGRFATTDEVAHWFFEILDEPDANIYATHEHQRFSTER